MKRGEQRDLIESSIISEEITDEVDMSGSGIADEIGTMSHARTTQDHLASRSRPAASSVHKQSNAMAKFTNSFIAEDSQLGFSMTGGAKFQANNAAAHQGKGNNDFATESSIQDEISVAGFGGSRSLQGRIVARNDGAGKNSVSPRSRAQS